MADLVRKPTLVMGARGSIGKHILDELIGLGIPVRASARRPEPGQFPDGIDVHAADRRATRSRRSTARSRSPSPMRPT